MILIFCLVLVVGSVQGENDLGKYEFYFLGNSRDVGGGCGSDCGGGGGVVVVGGGVGGGGGGGGGGGSSTFVCSM